MKLARFCVFAVLTMQKDSEYTYLVAKLDFEVAVGGKLANITS